MRSSVKILFWICLSLSIVFTANAESIRFQPGDTIDVTVFNSPELSGSFRINTDGYIRMPLVGKILASGKTEEELNEAIRTAVDAFIKNPSITVIPKFSVSVLGSVGKAGTYTLTGSERVIEVIAMAGGLNPDASGKITLYRSGKKKIVFDSDKLYDDSSIGYLRPGDVLLANKKRFNRGDYSVLFSALYSISLTFYYINNR
jgi:protein involved in polysaccharide export with SLBB domain